jgi:hypothetical protein
MNRTNRTIISLIVCLFALASDGLSQNATRARTEGGREVLLFSDGTWKYADGPKEPAKSVANAKPSSATKLQKTMNGSFGIWFDPGKWKVSDSGPNESVEFRFNHVSGDGYAMVISERIAIPVSALKDFVLDSARRAAPDAKIISEEKRTVNGHEVLCLKFEGTIKEIPFAYYGYYYSGPAGTLQVITYTGQNLFAEFQKDFTDLLNGVEIYK